MAKRDYDDETAGLLKSIADHFSLEDQVTRERQIRHYRRLKLYWANFSMIYWDEVAHDYKVYNRENSQANTDQDYYDKPVNVFKAFLETIIAALSIQIPPINCVPDDADNPLDVSTAKAGDKIAELIYKHNNVIFLWLHALYIFSTEGMIACYNYTDEDKEYGTYKKKKYEEQEVDSHVCPKCGAPVPDSQFDPENGDGPSCIECGSDLDPEAQKVKLKVTRLVGVTNEPKSRVCLEMYGGLYIKISNSAKKQKDTPYLIQSYETHYSNALECYPDLKDRLPHGGWSNMGMNTDYYEVYGRLNTQYRGEIPDENVTVKNCWFRPSAFNILPEDQYKVLKRKFPHGCRFVMVNDIPAEYEDEDLDDHWTLTRNPTADFLNHDPMGECLTNIQDIVNDLISLTLQTIEHGIAQTFADPGVVNFAAQKQIETMPGTITPSKPLSGSRDIKSAFFTLQLASLSPEVMNFYKIIQELGQFVSGALPSIFGGNQNAGSSRTASEYSMSKGMALQRLQTPWRMIAIWWKEIFAKAIPMYMKAMVEDERIVEKDKQGNFINVFIRKAETDGRIGSIELEAAEKLPISDEQQADMIMQLFQINNQEVTAALMDPENLPFIAKIIKIPEFKIPGQEDRQKQYEEILELVNSTSIPPDPQEVQAFQQAQQMAAQSGQPAAQQQPPQEKPSVEIDVDVDNHVIEAAICKTWLISSVGRLAKQENPEGYKNVLLHMKAHLAVVQQQQQAQQLHDDQMAIATGKHGGDKVGEPPSKVPSKKPPQHSGQIKGATSANTPIQ